jgi:eukaryotic-like serine/threonine-protein kinase
MNAQTFGPYQLLKKLATGGMAEVFLARHSGIEGFQRLLVVKRILPHLADDPEFVQMFLNEARIAARFSHPNIAQIYDLGEANGTYFIAMEFVHGEDLGRVMRKAWSSGQWIARPLAIRIVASACEALYYAHTRNDERGVPLRVVHRDISPQNILISFDGSVKLVDFGIAKAADAQSMTRSGAIKGKFAYMSPEQASGKPLDARSDIFAAGLVLYELLTGVRPLKRDNEIATLQAALECKIEPPSKVADVPAELDSVVMSALTHAADDRYRDARVFQMALEELLVQQRWVATSVQLSELMAALFRDRLEQEAQLGYPAPSEESVQSSPAVPVVSSPGREPSGELSWDAPPARPPEGRGALARKSGRGGRPTGKPSRESLPRTTPPPQDVAGWDAPPAEDIPGPRRNSLEARAPEPRRSGDNVTAIARSASRPNLRAVEEPPRRTGSVTGAPRVASSSSASVRVVGEVQTDDDEGTLRPEVGEARPPKRRTGGFAASVGKRQSGLEMPEAPPRRLTWEEEEEQEARASARARRQRNGEDRAARRQPKILQAMVLFALVVVLAGAGVVFRKPLGQILASTAADGTEVAVVIDSNQRVEIYVEHAATENRPGRVHLGSNPVRRPRGVHVGDTIVLENRTQGIYHREVIPFTEPGDTVDINKVFKSGSYRFQFSPKHLRDLSIHLGGQEHVRWQPGLAAVFAEGKHQVEVHGLQLDRPVTMEIEVKAGPRPTEGKPFDLTPYLK